MHFLESIEKGGKDFSPIHVFYTSTESEYEKGYAIVKDIFSDGVIFHKWNGEEGFLATWTSKQFSDGVGVKKTVVG